MTEVAVDAYDKLKVRDIAVRINAHLNRFEQDKDINKPIPKWGTTPYYAASASASGRYISVCYVSYQGHTPLTKAEAAAYLRKLDGGFVGRHFEALR